MPHAQLPVANRPMAAPKRREAETEEDEARGHPEPALLDALVHDGAGDGLDGRQLAHRGAAARAEARAGRELLAALKARAVLDRRRAHGGLVPRPPSARNASAARLRSGPTCAR